MSQDERIEHSNIVITNDGTIGELAEIVKKTWNTRVVNN
jgi:dephospho-CoA kinase